MRIDFWRRNLQPPKMALPTKRPTDGARPMFEPLEQRQFLSITLPALDSSQPPPIIGRDPIIVLPPVNQATGSVTGKVTDSNGVALANARVRLIPDQASTGPTVFSPSDVPAPLGPPLSAQTDADGNYTIEHVPAGNYAAVAHDQGYARNETSTFAVGTTSSTAPTIQLTALTFGSVSGTVTDANGHPLANARVWIMPADATTPPTSNSGATPSDMPVQGPPGPGMLPPPRSALFATTDSSGHYNFDQVIAGSYIVSVHDEGYVKNSSAAFTVAQGPNTAPTVALAPMILGTVTGTVTDGAGNPVAGAIVRLTPASSDSSQPTVDAPGQGNGNQSPPPAPVWLLNGLIAVTGSDGSYTINNVPAGAYTAMAHAPGYMKAVSASFNVVQGANTVPALSLNAFTFGDVSGLVTDGDGAGVSNAWVEISQASPSEAPNQPPMPWSWGSHQFAQTDSTGHYSFANVLSGTYTVKVYDHGFVPASSAPLVVATGTNTVPTIQLSAIVYGTVTGKITDSTGTGLAGAWVRLAPGDGDVRDWDQPVFYAQTDADGNYTFNNVPTGSYTLFARDPDYQRGKTNAFDVVAGSNVAPALALVSG